MVLVPQEFIGRLQETKSATDTKQQSVADNDSLDMQMNTILNSKNLDDSEKWKQYQQVLQRFLRVAEQKRQPIELPIVGDATTPSLDNEQVDEIADTFTRHYRSDARKLLKMVARHSDVLRWDRNRRVYIDNKLLPGANIVDIMHAIVRLRRHMDPPPGWEQVMTVLRDLNIPITHIHNPNALEFLGYDSTRQPTMASGNSTFASSSPYSTPREQSRIQRLSVFDTPPSSARSRLPRLVRELSEAQESVSSSTPRRWETWRP